MSKVIAYIRTSTDKQDILNQRHEVLKYANENKIFVNEMIELEMSSRKTTKERLIDHLLEILVEGDTLIISELSRLGRSTGCVINTVNKLLDKKVRLIIIKQRMNFNTQDIATKVMIIAFAMFGELERDLISQRTKDALAYKRAMGIKLGKPKGIIQPSIFDKDIDKIRELYNIGLSVRKIAKYLGYKSSMSLNYFVNRKIKNVSQVLQK